MRLVFGDVPGDLAAEPDDTILRAGDDEMEGLEHGMR